MTSYDDPVRQTGRTTRMLLEAWNQARCGRNVCVVAVSSKEFDHMQQLLIMHAPEFHALAKSVTSCVIELKRGSRIVFMAINDPKVERRARPIRVRGRSVTSVVFTDHHVDDVL